MTPHRVHAWIADTGGCGYYRGVLPHTVLGQLPEWDTTTSSILPDPTGLDLLWAQRVSLPGPTTIIRHITDNHIVPVVVDVDDALDLIPETSLAPYAYYRGPTAGDVLAVWADNLRAADLVTTSTLPLARHLVETHGVADAVVVPNTIDQAAASEPLHPIHGHPFPTTIGYQGSDTHHPDVGIVAYALRRVAARHPDDGVGLQTIGQDWRRPIARRSSPQWGRGDFPLGELPARWTYPDRLTRHHPWLDNIVELYQVVQGFDIGIAPLAPIAFNLHKSPIKLLEYGHLGVPWIASDIGPYRQWSAEAGSAAAAGGIVVGHNEHEWLDALELLIGDPDLRRSLADNGRRWAAHWTTQTHAGNHAALYTQLITEGHLAP